MKNFVSFAVGLLFALGLGFSGMTQTHVVKGFLDIFGDWNMSLMGVMIGAILVHSIAYQLVKKRESPLLDTKFHLPTKKDVDKKLLIGAVLFGIGWGWSGICPGPAIVSLASGQLGVMVFVAAMMAGMYLFRFFEKKFL